MDTHYSYILWTSSAYSHSHTGLVASLGQPQSCPSSQQLQKREKKKELVVQNDNPAVKERLATILSNSFYDLLVIQLKGFNFINALNSAISKSILETWQSQVSSAKEFISLPPNTQT